MIDQTSVNLLDLIPTQMKKVASTNGGEYHGACPMCGGKDRFVVQPNAGNGGRWFCRKCSESGGDAIAFLMAYSGLSFKDACSELKIHLNLDEWSKSQPNHHSRKQRQADNPTLLYSREKQTGSDGKRWQQRAKAFLNYAESQMWESDIMRRYLWQRGFYDSTIRFHGLGYNPSNVWDDWGLDKKVWLPAGLVIPYEHGDHATITKIRIRRDDWTEGDDTGKYIPPAGVKNTAFTTRKLLMGDYVLLVEGELDAIIFKQEVLEPEFVAMATGGTHGAKLLRYIALLALAKRVFVAFDGDESGEKASKYWLDALPNAVRLRPTRHDINDLVMADDNLYDWIRKAM